MSVSVPVPRNPLWKWINTVFHCPLSLFICLSLSHYFSFMPRLIPFSYFLFPETATLQFHFACGHLVHVHPSPAAALHEFIFVLQSLMFDFVFVFSSLHYLSLYLFGRHTLSLSPILLIVSLLDTLISSPPCLLIFRPSKPSLLSFILQKWSLPYPSVISFPSYCPSSFFLFRLISPFPLPFPFISFLLYHSSSLPFLHDLWQVIFSSLFPTFHPSFILFILRNSFHLLISTTYYMEKVSYQFVS